MKEKIKLLADLSSVLEDEEVLNTLNSKPNGERIVAIFKIALEKEIESIFNSKVEEVLNPVNQLLDRIKEASSQLDKLLNVRPALIASTTPVDSGLATLRPLNVPLAPTAAPGVAEPQVSQFREPPRRTGRQIDFE